MPLNSGPKGVRRGGLSHWVEQVRKGSEISSSKGLKEIQEKNPADKSLRFYEGLRGVKGWQ
jgi:hypothetical protein